MESVDTVGGGGVGGRVEVHDVGEGVVGVDKLDPDACNNDSEEIQQPSE